MPAATLVKPTPEIWQYFFGAIFVIGVIFFKAGIVGSVTNLINRLRVRLSGEPMEMSEHGLSYYRTPAKLPGTPLSTATTGSSEGGTQ